MKCLLTYFDTNKKHFDFAWFETEDELQLFCRYNSDHIRIHDSIKINSMKKIKTNRFSV